MDELTMIDLISLMMIDDLRIGEDLMRHDLKNLMMIGDLMI